MLKIPHVESMQVDALDADGLIGFKALDNLCWRSNRGKTAHLIDTRILLSGA